LELALELLNQGQLRLVLRADLGRRCSQGALGVGLYGPDLTLLGLERDLLVAHLVRLGVEVAVRLRDLLLVPMD
jgi:hypothetical protein